MTEQNLLKNEYETRGGPKLSENASKFLDTLWRMILRQSEVSVYEATISAGFEDDGDEELFFPFCARLVQMGLLSATTELSKDVTREEVIEGTKKEGVRYADPSFGREGYTEEELARFGFEENDQAYSLVRVAPSEELRKAMGTEDEESTSDSSSDENLQDPASTAETETAVESTETAEPETAAPEIVAPETTTSEEASPEATSLEASNPEVEATEAGTGELASGDRSDPLGIGAYWRQGESVAKIKSKSDRAKTKICEIFVDPEQGLETEETFPREEEISDYNLKKSWRSLSDSIGLQLLSVREEIIRAKAVARLGDEDALDHLTELFRTHASLKDASLNSSASEESLEEVASPGDEIVQETSLADVETTNAIETEKSGDEVGGSEVAIGKGPTRMVLGRTRAKMRRYAMVGVGGIVAALIVFLAVRDKNRVDQVTDRMEEHLDNPSTEYRLVKRREMEAMQERVEELAAQNAAMLRERESAITLEIEKYKRSQADVIRAAEKRAYDKGRQDASGLTPSAKDRLQQMALGNAVINGQCEALGRGNRIDKIFPVNLPVHVMYWLVDPSELKIAGVVSVNDELLTRPDGPVTQIRCISGRSDVWPSYGEPAIGANGQAKPIAQDGSQRETNPLLRP